MAQPAEVDPTTTSGDEFAAALTADQQTATDPLPMTAASPAAPGQSLLRQMNPNISLILDAGLGWFHRAEHIEQGGHAMDTNGFAIQGLELAATASVDPFFRFDMNFELAHLHLEEVYLTTLALPLNLQARLGYLNAEFGRQNPRHLHNWHFVNPPLSHTRFMAEEHFSGTGAEVSALLPLPWYVMVVGQALGTGDSLALRSSSFAPASYSTTGRTDGVEDFVYIGRLVSSVDASDDWSVNLGLDTAWGQSPYVPDNFVNLFGADLYVKWRPISTGDDATSVAFTVEYVLRDTQVPDDSVRDHGGYVQLDVQLDRFWMVSARGDTVARVHGVPPERSPLAGRQVRGSFVMANMPTHFSKIRLQVDVGRETRERVYVAGFIQLEVSAGEHGAHAF
jgi:hypothetical protein